MVSVTNRLKRVRLPAGKVFKKIGDIENCLYFIASGTLKETTFIPLNKEEKKHRKAPVYLAAGDIVGDIYPFEEQKISQSYTETITSSELGKISKQGLITICTRYPNVAHSIINLFKDRQAGMKESSLLARKSNRHLLPLKMKLKIRPKEAGYPPFILDGFSRDISVGGVCVVLDAKHKNIISLAKNIKDAGVTIFIPGGGFTLNVSCSNLASSSCLFPSVSLPMSTRRSPMPASRSRSIFMMFSGRLVVTLKKVYSSVRYDFFNRSKSMLLFIL